ncbi:MAG: hypothetical protein AAGA74_02300 [Pseudomonadota bacterium]
MRDLVEIEQNSTAIWASKDSLLDSVSAGAIASHLVRDAINDGKELPRDPEEDEVRKRLIGLIADRKSETDDLLEAETFEARRDLKNLVFDLGRIESIVSGSKHDLEGCVGHWRDQFETRATAVLKARTEVRVYEVEFEINPTDLDHVDEAKRVTRIYWVVDASMIAASLWSAGTAGGILGALVLSASLSFATIMAGSLAGKALAKAKAAKDPHTRRKHKAASLGLMGVGCALPVITALYRGGLEAFTQPQTYVVGIITFGLLKLVSEAWSKVRDDSRYAALLKARDEAEALLEEAFESGPYHLERISGQGVETLDAWLEERETRWQEDGDAALDYISSRVDRHTALRDADHQKAHDAQKDHWDRVVHGVDGHEVSVPDHMRLAPNLSGFWAPVNRIVTTDWAALHSGAESRIKEARVRVPEVQTDLRAAFSTMAQTLQSAEDAIRSKLRDRLVRGGRDQVTGSNKTSSDKE